MMRSDSRYIGQRYDVIFHADKGTILPSFWMRAIPQQVCSSNWNVDNIRGIMHYTSTPTTPQTDPYAFMDNCNDEPLSSLIPHVPKTVSAADWRNLTDVTIAKNNNLLFRWYLNSTTMEVLWKNPTLLQLAENKSVAFNKSNAVIHLPEGDKWVYLVISTKFIVPHPIHLHGHDFFILAQGVNPWNGSVMLENPPRRDTAMLPGDGYLVIAFYTDNPGAWLMHCHIGWHTTEGFAVQFIEREKDLRRLIRGDEEKLRWNCDAWRKYDKANNLTQDDSGV